MTAHGTIVRLRLLTTLTASLPLLLAPAAVRAGASDDSLLARRAERLAQDVLIVDTHIDLPSRLIGGKTDVSVRQATGDFDFVRAREGGLDVPFMSIYVPSELEGTGKARKKAEELIAAVRGLTERWPEKFAMVTSVRDIEDQRGRGKVMLAMGMENGASIEGKISNVRHFHRLGVRYITLAHARSNHLSDASYDRTRRWNGLSPFGRTVVGEMNRVGIMVDVSHLTDSAFYDVLQVSRAPVIASHSSCRHFTPGFERNMSDEMIRALAAAGGVIQINFGSEFISQESRLFGTSVDEHISDHLRQQGWKKGGAEAKAYSRQYRATHPLPRATVADVARHIDHVVRLVGDAHVGLGSDFDGVGDTLPVGLEDVSGYPALIAEMLRLGYTRERIEKICGLNLLRVWREVERTAEESGGS